MNTDQQKTRGAGPPETPRPAGREARVDADAERGEAFDFHAFFYDELTRLNAEAIPVGKAFIESVFAAARPA